jgi:hypothetical protein
MRTLIASTFVSLDGVMQAPGGPEEDPGGGSFQCTASTAAATSFAKPSTS